MAAGKLKKEQQNQSAERESADTGKVNDEDEEHLYGNIDDYKHLIQDEEYDDEDVPHDLQLSEDEYNSERDSSLLAEFSDYGEISEDDEEDFMNAIREASNFKVKRRKMTKVNLTAAKEKKECLIQR